MCGICGFLDFKGRIEDSETLLGRMAEALRHRGPDGIGVFSDGPAGLGHTRLSIIDLEKGHQPLFNEDGSVALVCNGEIYNYKDLRRRLLKNGHRFRTDSDSEVILHLWEEKGTACVEELRGMFGFALYDSHKKVIFGARDRFGQKPFFYHDQGNTFTFASEIKALLALPSIRPELNPAALDQFLFFRYIPHPDTLFKGVRQLPPAHFFWADPAGLRITPYWRNRFFESGHDRNPIAHLERLKAEISDAVRSHLVSDVPVGIFLSGGIDSSLVAALAAGSTAKPLKSFSIAFPGHRYDESRYARMASDLLGTEHHEFPYEPGHIESNIEKMARIFDQPLADPAALPLSFLSEHASRHVKVVLTGDGGDELFAGYEKYCEAGKGNALSEWLIRRFPGLFSMQDLARCATDRFHLRRLRSRTALRLWPANQCRYSKNAWEGWHRHRLYSEEFRNQLLDVLEPVKWDSIDRNGTDTALKIMLDMDQNRYLPDDLLLKTDYSTMAHGLEARAPLLDHHLALTAASLPDHLLADNAQTKIALRRIASELLPRELVQRRKRGFSVPIKKWFRDELKDWTTELLLNTSATVPRYFRPDAVKAVLEAHAAGRRNHTQKIFTLVVFELWHRHYLS